MFFLGIVITVAAYLIGSLSAALIVSKKFGMPDPRGYGSGNPGASNMLRSGRKDAAAWTLAGDALKGLAAVILARCFMSWLDMGPGVVAWAAIAVVVGHMWPLFYGFRGGKGVATALGVLLGMSFSVTLLVVGVWAVIALKFKKSSLAALVAAVVAPWAMFVIDRANHRPSWGWALVVIAALVIFRHRENIKRLCSGNESNIGETAQPFQNHNPYAQSYTAPAAAAVTATVAAAPAAEQADNAVADAVAEVVESVAETEPAPAEQQPEPETAVTEEPVDASQADLRDGDELEEAVIAEAANHIQAAADAQAEPLVQVETLPETEQAEEPEAAEETVVDKPKRTRKPRKGKNDTAE